MPLFAEYSHCARCTGGILINHPSDMKAVTHQLTMEVPEELAEEATEAADSREEAVQYVLDHSTLCLDFGDSEYLAEYTVLGV